MLPIFRIFEVAVFALVNFGPYVALSVYTFYEQMRFSKLVTGLACSALICIQFSTRYWSALNNISSSVWMSILRLIIFMSVYAILFNIKFRKIVFIELIFANIGNFIIIAAVCIERNLFLNTEHHLYCWHTTLAMVLLHLMLTLPLAIMIKNYYKPMITNKFVGYEWYYYWIVPAIFYLIWQYQINGGKETGLEVIVDPGNAIFLFLINIGAFLIYQIMLLLDGQLAKNLELKEINHYREMEALKYQVLEERIEDARRARHDMRHHMIIMSDYLDAGDYGHLREYLNDYRQSLPDNQAIVFCPHRAINSVLLYYAYEAKENDIDFQVQLSISDKLNIPDMDISVLLGNLLENAIDSCLEYKGMRSIIIRGVSTKHSLSFTIDNTCGNDVKRNQNGQFITTKKKGSGLGLESVKHIVERYNGVFNAEKKEDMFYVSFMLNL